MPKKSDAVYIEDILTYAVERKKARGLEYFG